MSADLRLALGITLAGRILYGIAAVFFAAHAHPSAEQLASNPFSELAMQPSAGLPYYLWGVWERFDGMWYKHIAEFGYDHPAAGVFYPLFPFLIRLLTFVVRDSTVAGLLISTAATVFLWLAVLKLTRPELGEVAARRAVLYGLLWPGAFILFAVYAESLVIALSLWAILAAQRDQWVRAGMLAAAAAAAKAIGIAAMAAVLWIVWKRRREIRWTELWPLALPLAAEAVVAVVIRGAGLVSVEHTYNQRWNTVMDWPWLTLADAFRQSMNADLLASINLGFLILVAILSLGGPLGSTMRIYVAACLTIVTVKHSQPILESTIRYLLPVFPAYANLAARIGGRIWLELPVLLLMLPFNAILLAAFIGWSHVL